LFTNHFFKITACWILGILLASCGGGGGANTECDFNVVVSGPFSDTFKVTAGKTLICSSSGTPATVQLTNLAQTPAATQTVKSVYLEYTGIAQGDTANNVAVIVTVTDGDNNQWESSGGDCLLAISENVSTEDSTFFSSTYGTGSVTCSVALAPSGGNVLGALTISSMTFTGLIPY
jgi:hypothetical protein